MLNKIKHSVITCSLVLLAGASSSVFAQDNELSQLAQDVAQLQAEISRLEAIDEIENLQRIYGFYIDKHLWTQAADLFTEDGSIEIGGEGVYSGKQRVLAYLKTQGAEGPQEGILNDHMQLQPVITVYDNDTAKGRWHHFSQEAEHGVSHYLGSGIYENDYVKEEGVWKLKRLQRYTSMHTSYDDGWHVSGLPRSTPNAALAPDSAPTVAYENYPAVFIPPFHYENPVTSPETAALADESVLSSLTSVEAISAALDAMRERVTRINDINEVEQLQTVYGYYLARNQWDELTGIFAEEGTIEIALRGVYVGRESVRRNLDLYGAQDQLPGQLHNHMQYQPVIHLSEDGNTALLRSRALSMMGTYGQDGRWMGGTYENVYIKRDGVWQILVDQQMNTYFASFDNGWKDLVWRPAPGITEANPPDRPPSIYFEMYPRAFLPPFHYVNPVTGK